MKILSLLAKNSWKIEIELSIELLNEMSMFIGHLAKTISLNKIMCWLLKVHENTVSSVQIETYIHYFIGFLFWVHRYKHHPCFCILFLSPVPILAVYYIFPSNHKNSMLFCISLEGAFGAFKLLKCRIFQLLTFIFSHCPIVFTPCSKAITLVS